MKKAMLALLVCAACWGLQAWVDLKFRGVGISYLGNYLAWFRVVAQEPNTARPWLIVGVTRLTNAVLEQRPWHAYPGPICRRCAGESCCGRA